MLVLLPAAATAQGVRSVFLSNAGPAATRAPTATQQQQPAVAIQPPLHPPGAAAAAEGEGGLPRLLPRRSLDAAGQLHAILHGLFPPGVEIPLPLQLAAAVHACAAASGTPLHTPVLALLPPGAPPSVGMVPMGVVEGPALAAWQQAVELVQPPPLAPQHPQAAGGEAEEGSRLVAIACALMPPRLCCFD
jgi:hypothetical protein